jgi:hypothetical protein
VEQSILISTKKVLGIAENYTAFDLDILTHINTAFTTLTQLGIGPSPGFIVEDETAVWTDFIGSDLELQSVKSYVFLRVRMLFDPPQTSYLIEAMTTQIEEIEWRLNVHREASSWVDPDPDELPDEEPIEMIDGGVV